METLESVRAELASARAELAAEKVAGAISRSPFMANVALPADMITARFANAFSVEDGRIVAKDANGNVMISRTRMGEPASVDEALEELIGAHPAKGSILKAAGSSRSNHSATGVTVMSRDAFEALSPRQKMQLATSEGGLQLFDLAGGSPADRR
jgi:hypothetical protein